MEKMQNDVKKKQMIFIKTLQKMLKKDLTPEAMN